MPSVSINFPEVVLGRGKTRAPIIRTVGQGDIALITRFPQRVRGREGTYTSPPIFGVIEGTEIYRNQPMLELRAESAVEVGIIDVHGSEFPLSAPYRPQFSSENPLTRWVSHRAVNALYVGRDEVMSQLESLNINWAVRYVEKIQGSYRDTRSRSVVQLA